MLQANEIQQKFQHLQQTIDEAEQVCRTNDSTPPELRDCVEKLARESHSANEVLRSNDQTRITQCIDNLESMGDEAKRISRSAENLPAHLETVVTQMHSELSQLKHQIH